MKIKYRDENGCVITKEINLPTFCKLTIRDMILLKKQIEAYETKITELKQQKQDIDIANKIFKLKIDITELENMQSAIHRKVIKITGNENFWRENNLSIEEFFYDERFNIR